LFNNVLSFYELYRDEEVESNQVHNVESSNVLDQWIMARLNQVVVESTAALDAYDLFKPTRTLRDFIDDLSTWYLRRSRDRIKDGDVDAKRTLYTVMKITAKLMGPFAPFFAEYVWQKLKTSSDEESIHLALWPESGGVNQELIASMLQARNFTTMGNARRKLKNIPIRQPLRRFLIKHSFEPIPYWEEIKLILADELNVKEVSLVSEGEVEGGYDFDWDINEELKLEGEYRELIRLIQDMRKEKGLTPQEEIQLTLPENYSEIVATFGVDLKKTVGAKEVLIGGEIHIA
jgi:isoleucyl-tRNA synthetase